MIDTTDPGEMTAPPMDGPLVADALTYIQEVCFTRGKHV